MDQVQRPVTQGGPPPGRPRQIWLIAVAAAIQAILLSVAASVLLLEPERLPAFGLTGGPVRGVTLEGWANLVVAALLAIGAVRLPRRRISALLVGVPLALVLLPFLWIKLFPVFGPVVLGWSAAFAVLPLICAVVAFREPARSWMLPSAPAGSDPATDPRHPPTG